MKQCARCEKKKKGLKRYCVVELKTGSLSLSKICSNCKTEVEKRGFIYKVSKGDTNIMPFIERAKKDIKEMELKAKAYFDNAAQTQSVEQVNV